MLWLKLIHVSKKRPMASEFMSQLLNLYHIIKDNFYFINNDAY